MNTHLGDNVYANTRDGTIILTEHDAAGMVTNVILLRPEMFAALVRYVSDLLMPKMGGE